MIANDLILPEAATTAIVADVTRHGEEHVETGGFLLAPRDADTISIVALAGTVGIVRRRDLLQVSERALDRLFAHADEHDLWLPAQFHSHGLEAFMSTTDINHGLSVEGFISMIVPHYEAPPINPSAWGWWRYQDAWTSIAPPKASLGAVFVIKFDEDGVRGA
ncbi:MAG: hypothetical protein ACYC1P_04725 [Gaiellaceae bacterium]